MKESSKRTHTHAHQNNNPSHNSNITAMIISIHNILMFFCYIQRSSFFSAAVRVYEHIKEFIWKHFSFNNNNHNNSEKKEIWYERKSTQRNNKQ